MEIQSYLKLAGLMVAVGALPSWAMQKDTLINGITKDNLPPLIVASTYSHFDELPDNLNAKKLLKQRWTQLKWSK